MEEIPLLSDTEQEERAKPHLLPEEEDLLAFLKMGGAAGNSINAIMPHRSIEEWSAWVDHSGNSRRSRKLPMRLRELDRVSEFIDARIAAIAKEYPRWYPDAPLEKPELPRQINQFPILSGMDFDLIRWYACLPGKVDSSRELNDAITKANESLCEEYPHMSMPYLEKISKNMFDPMFFMKAREAVAFFEEHESLYDEWLGKAFPDHYSQGEPTKYNFVETRVVDADRWNTIEKIVRRGKVGKKVMYKLLDHLPSKLVHEAFYRSSGLSGPALKFMKTYGDVSIPIKGVWTEAHDTSLLENDMTVIGRLHGYNNIAVRKRFLASKYPEIMERRNPTEKPLTQRRPGEILLAGSGVMPSPETTQRVIDQGGLDEDALAQSRKDLEDLPESEMENTADFIQSVYDE
ncbi:hypothetical protein CJU89_3328 [Yarrowia sp. B02]|nr:hypothetical protein CJU89_3328 [Yarrowia sp. B02]